MIALAVFVLFAQSTGSINGMVTDAVTHQPIHHARVRAAYGPGDISDADGHYGLTGLPAGDVGLTVESDGYRRLQTSATVAQGGSLKVDLELHPLARLTGRIVDHDTREPIAIRVRLERRADDRGFYGMPDKDGRFEFPNLEPGDYSLTTLGIDDVAVRFVKPDADKPRHRAYGDSVYPATIHIGEGERKVLDIGLTAVESHTVAGTFEIPAGREADSLLIDIGNDNRTVDVKAPVTHSNSFGIEGLTRGEYTFSATLGTGPGSLWGTLQFTITENDIEGARLAFGPTASLTGTMQEAEDGVAVPRSVNIILIPAGAGIEPRLQMPVQIREGRFAIDGIAPGNYWPLLINLPAGFALLRGDGRPMAVFGAAEVTLSLTSKAGAIAGTLRDGNQNPLKGEFVELIPDLVGEGPDSVMNMRIPSGPSGEFFFRDLAPGKYTVNGTRVEVGPSQTVTIALTGARP